MYTDLEEEGSPPGTACGLQLAASVRQQLTEFLAPLARQLDFWLDRRLVRTLVRAVEVILAFVPGMHWLAVMLCGLSPKSGPVQAGVMKWWTTRGEHATDARTVQSQVLAWCMKEWRQRVLHLFDRGYAGHPWLNWLSLLLFTRRVSSSACPNRYKLVGLTAEGTVEPREDPEEEREGRPAWQLARGKKAWDQKRVYDTHTHQQRSIAILALPVRHPALMTTMWLVVARSGHGREPWYLLTSEPVETKEDAWRIYFAYHRRWQVEMAFRFNKCELEM
jgi:hypothetical protein